MRIEGECLKYGGKKREVDKKLIVKKILEVGKEKKLANVLDP